MVNEMKYALNKVNCIDKSERHFLLYSVINATSTFMMSCDYNK